VRPLDLTGPQRALWDRVERLWDLLGAPEASVRAALHPDYCGWVTGEDLPHDREAGVRAAVGPAPQDRELTPLHVGVHGGTGVVHYRYRATLGSPGEPARTVTGRWTEVYVEEGGTWLLFAVSGGPDVPLTGA
jgi:hypothetical protein